MRGFIALAAAFMVGGCLTSFDEFRAELPKYNGRPIENLFAKLGYPNAEQTIGGRKIYVWSTNQSYSYMATSNTFATVGGVPVYGTTLTPANDTLSCTLRIYVDAQGLVSGGDWNGNNAACYTYSNRLK